MFTMVKIFLMAKKSIAFRVSWGSNKKTLSEEEINEEANLIISNMQKNLGATLR